MHTASAVKRNSFHDRWPVIGFLFTFDKIFGVWENNFIQNHHSQWIINLGRATACYKGLFSCNQQLQGSIIHSRNDSHLADLVLDLNTFCQSFEYFHILVFPFLSTWCKNFSLTSYTDHCSIYSQYSISCVAKRRFHTSFCHDFHQTIARWYLLRLRWLICSPTLCSKSQSSSWWLENSIRPIRMLSRLTLTFNNT